MDFSDQYCAFEIEGTTQQGNADPVGDPNYASHWLQEDWQDLPIVDSVEATNRWHTTDQVWTSHGYANSSMVGHEAGTDSLVNRCFLTSSQLPDFNNMIETDDPGFEVHVSSQELFECEFEPHCNPTSGNWCATHSLVLDNPDRYLSSSYKRALRLNTVTAVADSNRRLIEPGTHDLIAAEAALKRKRPRFEDDQVESLQAWLDSHPDDPYPSNEDINAISLAARLKPSQVRNWFSRIRQRKMPHLQECDCQSCINIGDRTTHSVHDHQPPSRALSDDELSSSMNHLSLDVGPASIYLGDIKDEAGDDLWGDPDSMHTETELCKNQGPVTQNYESRLEWWMETIAFDTPDRLEFAPEISRNVSDCAPTEGEISSSEQRSSSFPWSSDAIATLSRSQRGNNIIPPGTIRRIAERTKSNLSSQLQLREQISKITSQASCITPTDTGRGRQQNKQVQRAGTPFPDQSRIKEQLFTQTSVTQNVPKLSPRSEAGSENSMSAASGESVESVHSSVSASTYCSQSSRKGRKIRFKKTEELGKFFSPSAVISTSSRPTNKAGLWNCSHCSSTFSKKSAMIRHERRHKPEQWWICGITSQSISQHCPFCDAVKGFNSPTQCQHDMAACEFKSLRDRIFLRRDNFADHLRRIHRVSQNELRLVDLLSWQHAVTHPIHPELDDMASSRTQSSTKVKSFHKDLQQIEKLSAIPVNWSVVLDDA